MLADPFCWSALAVDGETVQAVITVSTVLYVEWGRLALAPVRELSERERAHVKLLSGAILTLRRRTRDEARRIAHVERTPIQPPARNKANVKRKQEF